MNEWIMIAIITYPAKIDGNRVKEFYRQRYPTEWHCRNSAKEQAAVYDLLHKLNRAIKSHTSFSCHKASTLPRFRIKPKAG